MLSVALVASSCGDPQVPTARSMDPDALVTATPLPPTVTPTPLPTLEPTATPEVGATPEPTSAPVVQPGLSGDTIRLAVIADADTGGVADDLFRDAFTGTLAWQTAVNFRGGIGDRFVEVVPLDARLFNHRAVLDVVCSGDYFAIVGSQSLGDYEGAELLGTERCDIADFPGDVHGARRAESPNTFVSNPFLNSVRQAGPARWLVEQFPEASENVALFYFDELQLRNETERLREMLVGEGMTVNSIDTNLEEGPSDRVLARWEEFGSEAIVWNADSDRLIDMLAALDEADATPTFVLCELNCFSERFLRDGGALVEGVYTWIPHAPFGSPTAAEELVDYRFWLDETVEGAEWSEVGLESWMAGRLFEEAFDLLLEFEPEAPTREGLIFAARAITDFDAAGILPFTDPGERRPTPCFALMVVRNGRWEQEYPGPPRDLDCDPDNLYPLVATRVLGLDAPTAASSTSSEDVDEQDPEVAPEADPADDDG